MPDTIDAIVDIRSRMIRLRLCQISIVNMFVATGRCADDKRCSFSTQLNFALTGKRTTKRYKEILSDVSDMLCELENENNE